MAFQLQTTHHPPKKPQTKKPPNPDLEKGTYCISNWKIRNKFRAPSVPEYKGQMLPSSPACCLSLTGPPSSFLQYPSFAGQGAPGLHPQGPSWGLCLFIISPPHNLPCSFGSGLRITLDMEPSRAILGGSVGIPSLTHFTENISKQPYAKVDSIIHILQVKKL